MPKTAATSFGTEKKTGSMEKMEESGWIRKKWAGAEERHYGEAGKN